MCVALGLTIGARRLGGLRLELAEDAPGTTSAQVAQLRTDLSGLQAELQRFGEVLAGDNDAGPVDR